MYVEFQKAIIATLTGLSNTHCFQDDTIIKSKTTEKDHMQFGFNCLMILEIKTAVELYAEFGISLIQRSLMRQIIHFSHVNLLKDVIIFYDLCSKIGVVCVCAQE